MTSSSIAGTPTAPDVHDRLLYLFHRIRVATADAVANELSDLELTGTHALILESLHELGEAGAAELARRCLVSRQALSAPLDRLEKRGLISRPASDHSARLRPTTLTDEGRAVVATVRSRVGALEQRSREIFDSARLTEFEAMLESYASFWDNALESGTRHG
jgi:DNA-binding MarR family transcriptional regulator